MIKNDLILENPMRFLDDGSDNILEKGELGAVLARAGVGKTAFLVQIALDSLLRYKNVIHVSVDDPVSKICVWYEEIFKNIAARCNVSDVDSVFEKLLHKRFIMTFKIDGFSIPKLKERITELAEQNIFKPAMIIIDGFSFDNAKENLAAFKKFAEEYSLKVWFAILTHKDEKLSKNNIPEQFSEISDFFKAAIQLKPDAKNVNVEILKGVSESYALNRQRLILESNTMLLTKNE